VQGWNNIPMRSRECTVYSLLTKSQEPSLRRGLEAWTRPCTGTRGIWRGRIREHSISYGCRKYAFHRVKISLGTEVATAPLRNCVHIREPCVTYLKTMPYVAWNSCPPWQSHDIKGTGEGGREGQEEVHLYCIELSRSPLITSPDTTSIKVAAKRFLA